MLTKFGEVKKMKFHEDIIFKNHGLRGGESILRIMNLKGRIVKVHETEFSIIDPKMYKPDFVLEVTDKIYIIEFQSTYVDINDKKRFRFYTALIDHIKNKSNKDIEVHVLSTVEKEKTKFYKISDEAVFPIYIHSLKSFDGDEIINTISDKIAHNKFLNDDELMLLSLVPFMSNSTNVEQSILRTTYLISNIDDLDYDIGQFIKGIELILADKFIKTESIKITVANLLSGNMKIVEEYAQRKVDEVKEQTVLNMFEKGFSIEDIVDVTKYKLSFVKEVLASNFLI